MTSPLLEGSTFFDLLKMGHGRDLLFTLPWKTVETSLKVYEDLFFWRTIARCVFGHWSQAFLSLASRGSVLEKSVLGLGLEFFCVLGLGLEGCVLDSTSGNS